MMASFNKKISALLSEIFTDIFFYDWVIKFWDSIRAVWYSGLILKMHLFAQLPVASRQLPVASCQSPVASRQSQAPSNACDWQLTAGNRQLYLFEFTFLINPL
jgi:hypothetical protein